MHSEGKREGFAIRFSHFNTIRKTGMHMKTNGNIKYLKTTIITLIIASVTIVNASCEQLGIGSTENSDSQTAMIALAAVAGKGSSSSTGSDENTASTGESAASALTISYDSPDYLLVYGALMSDIIPGLEGESPTSCYVLPRLPTGLSIDPYTCAIIGKPLEILDKTSYVVTASGPRSSGQTTISFEIKSAGLNIPTTQTTLTETGTGIIEIALNTPPDGDVVLIISSKDTTELKLSVDGGTTAFTSIALSFTPSDWNSPQTVTLVGQNDGTMDGDKAVTITGRIDIGSTTDTTGYVDLADTDLLITVEDSPAAGNKVAYTIDDGFDSFNVVYVPPKTFPMGIDDNGDAGGGFIVASPATVSSGFMIGETEVTYKLWNEVRLWGATHGYSFAADQGSVVGASATDQFPVSSVSWRTAMIWCNALTEYINAMNGTSFTPVYYADSSYTILRKNANSVGDEVCQIPLDFTEGGCDNPFVKPDAKGFRLPTIYEWELAARYIADTDSDGILSTPDTEYNVGNRASGFLGAGSGFNTIDYAVYGATSPAPVKSKLPNALGLYDMSGNVMEWNYNTVVWNNTKSVRGGAFSYTITYLNIGLIPGIKPDAVNEVLGFRVARTW